MFKLSFQSPFIWPRTHGTTTVWKITIWLIDSWFFWPTWNIQKKNTLPRGQPIFGSWSYKILFRCSPFCWRLSESPQRCSSDVGPCSCLHAAVPTKTLVSPSMSRSLYSVHIMKRMLGKGNGKRFCFFQWIFKKKGWNNWSARNPGKYTPWN